MDGSVKLLGPTTQNFLDADPANWGLSANVLQRNFDHNQTKFYIIPRHFSRIIHISYYLKIHIIHVLNKSWLHIMDVFRLRDILETVHSQVSW